MVINNFSLGPPSVTEINCKQYKNLENQVFFQEKILPNSFSGETMRMAASS